MLPSKWVHGAVPLRVLAKGEFGPKGATAQTAQKARCPGQGYWLRQMGTGDCPPPPQCLPSARCPHIKAPAQPCRKLSLGARSPRRGSENPGVTQMPIIQHCCSCIFTEKRPRSPYRSLHFHVCIQGHFLNKSIQPSEYTIFMSQCILELKYSEENRKRRALKKRQLGEVRCFIVSSCSSQIYLRMQLRPLPSRKGRSEKRNTLNGSSFEFCLFSY